jgi:hypothetical protein
MGPLPSHCTHTSISSHFILFMQECITKSSTHADRVRVCRSRMWEGQVEPLRCKEQAGESSLRKMEDSPRDVIYLGYLTTLYQLHIYVKAYTVKQDYVCHQLVRKHTEVNCSRRSMRGKNHKSMHHFCREASMKMSCGNSNCSCEKSTKFYPAEIQSQNMDWIQLALGRIQ